MEMREKIRIMAAFLPEHIEIIFRRIFINRGETMFIAGELLPDEERLARQARCRRLLAERVPEAGGMMLFSRLNIYYLTGTYANGLFWLPMEGEALLLVRKGLERCRLESPGTNAASFRSYSDIAGLCAKAASPLSPVAAAEMSALPWSLGTMLQARLPGVRFVSDEQIMLTVRSVKSPWELAKMRICGERHHRSVYEILPGRLRPGMNEREIAHLVWQVFFEQGHCGVLRLGAYGEEAFLGHVAAGENGNYPSHYNGALGVKGEHPAAPFMGHVNSVWHKHEVLMLDLGFGFEGYSTDKTQMYWSGTRSSVPDAVRRAYELCGEVQERASCSLRPGVLPSLIWKDAYERVQATEFAEGFMGLGDNKVHFLGHGIGLVIDEQPVLAHRFDEPLQGGMTIAVEPKIGLPGIGMVGVENTFEVTPDGGKCITGNHFDMLCLD
jgi:Xaa-Pro dipeptidase